MVCEMQTNVVTIAVSVWFTLGFAKRDHRMVDAVGEFWHERDRQPSGADLAKAERRVRAFGTTANQADILTTLIATAVMRCCRYVFAVPT